MTTTTRPAQEEDIPWLVEQVEIFDKEYPCKHSLYGDHANAIRVVEMLVREHVVYVADHTAKGLIGFIAGVLVKHPLNLKVRLLSEMLWWVTPENRHSRAAAMLLDEFTKFGLAHADLIGFGFRTESDVAHHNLQKRGYVLKEYSYYLEV